jgi:putative membrane protein
VQNRLASLHGAEFDREYMNVMVDSHEWVEDLLERRAGTHERVTQWAAKTLPSVRAHRERAKEIRDAQRR